jgi:hypothetical protein
VFKIAQINVHQGNTIPLSKTLSAVELVMDMNERQIALSVLESLRGDLVYAHLNNGSRVLDVADLRQYIYALTGSPLEVTRIEQMGHIRTIALGMSDLYGNDNGHGQDIRKSNGHKGKAHQ